MPARRTRFEEQITVGRALAALSVPGAALGLVFFALADLPVFWKVVGGALGVGTIVLTTRRVGSVAARGAGRYWTFAAGALLVAYALTAGEGVTTPPLAAIKVLIGRLLLCAILVAALAGTRLLSVGKAVLVSVSLGGAIVLVDGFRLLANYLPALGNAVPGLVRALEGSPAGEVEWSQPIAMPHPLLGYVNRPRAFAKTYYPDNPRGYFFPEPSTDVIDNRMWLVDSQAGGKAEWTLPEGARDPFRITITDAGDQSPWSTRIATRVRLVEGKEYEIAVRARAREERTIIANSAGSTEPWGPVGLKEVPFALGTEWSVSRVKFRATATDEHSSILLLLGTTPGWVEIGEVSITSPGMDAAPPPQRRFHMGHAMNGAGFRDRERELVAPPGTYRIAVLGDSYVFGQGVRADDTLARRLEISLNAAEPADPPRFEVLSFGVCGYSTEQERILFEEVASKYKPQLVLVVMVHNDHISALDEMKAAASPGGGGGGGDGLPDYSVCVRELLRLDEACKRHAAKLVVVIFRFEPWREISALRETVSSGLAGTEIPLLDLGTVLLARHTRNDYIVHPIDAHPNELAHRLAAEEIERFLRARRLLEPVPVSQADR